MSTGEAFLIAWGITATAIGGVMGLAGYLGFRAGYAKARRTQHEVLALYLFEKGGTKDAVPKTGPA